MGVQTERQISCPSCGLEFANPEAKNGSVINHPYFSLNFSEMRVYVNGQNIGLTPKEYAIFEFLVKAKVVVTHGQFTNQHWGDYYGQTMRDAKIHISHIRSKFREADGQDPIMTRHALGYEIKDAEIIEREQGRVQQADNGHQNLQQ